LSDASLRSGDGLFETLRVDQGEARDVPAHLDRLFASLPRIALEIPEDREGLERAIAEAAAGAPRPTARLRLIATRGPAGEPTLRIETFPYQPPSEEDDRQGVPAVLLPDLRIDSKSPLAGLKSLSSYQSNHLALARAQAEGAWEALLLNEHGRLCEGSRSNLALRLDGILHTPPVSEGCLPGTARRRMIERGELRERPLDVEDLDRAEEMFLMNSLVGLLRVKLPILRGAGTVGG